MWNKTVDNPIDRILAFRFSIVLGHRGYLCINSGKTHFGGHWCVCPSTMTDMAPISQSRVISSASSPCLFVIHLSPSLCSSSSVQRLSTNSILFMVSSLVFFTALSILCCDNLRTTTLSGFVRRSSSYRLCAVLACGVCSVFFVRGGALR